MLATRSYCELVSVTINITKPLYASALLAVSVEELRTSKLIAGEYFSEGAMANLHIKK